MSDDGEEERCAMCGCDAEEHDSDDFGGGCGGCGDCPGYEDGAS